MKTLDARMPALLKQHPTVTEGFVRTVAQADPTGYSNVGWLLRMLESKQWEIVDAESMRGILESYESVKNSVNWTGHPTVDAYTEVADVVSDVEGHIQAHGTQNNEIQKPEPSFPEGAKQIASLGTSEVWEITTPKAAAHFAHGEGFDGPATQWPVINEKIAAKFLVAGPIYIVLIDAQPVAFVHFGRQEAKNVRNLELSPLDATVIAGLFTGQNFATEFGQIAYRPGGWQLTDDDIDEALKRLKVKFIAQRRAGFFLHSAWVEPIADEALLERRWKAKEPAFRHALKMAQKDNDHAVIRKAGRKHPEPKGMQALANAVYELERA